MSVRCLNVSQTYKYTYKYKRIIKEKRNKREKKCARVRAWVMCNDEVKGARLRMAFGLTRLCIFALDMRDHVWYNRGDVMKREGDARQLVVSVNVH